MYQFYVIRLRACENSPYDCIFDNLYHAYPNNLISVTYLIMSNVILYIHFIFISIKKLFKIHYVNQYKINVKNSINLSLSYSCIHGPLGRPNKWFQSLNYQPHLLFRLNLNSSTTSPKQPKSKCNNRFKQCAGEISDSVLCKLNSKGR